MIPSSHLYVVLSVPECHIDLLLQPRNKAKREQSTTVHRTITQRTPNCLIKERQKERQKHYTARRALPLESSICEITAKHHLLVQLPNASPAPITHSSSHPGTKELCIGDYHQNHPGAFSSGTMPRNALANTAEALRRRQLQRRTSKRRLRHPNSDVASLWCQH
ncbi:hypothetical protein BX600DRAFT_475719 [Xylariales sp. PMI_506]|nr:hypothetical protein BX600DRAFT_475719 [Xylariales sp. PMI_506]